MRADTRSFYESAVLRAVADVCAGLDQALDLQRLARRAALSPFHFHRVFRGLVGETPLELHRRLRLERAAEQLASGSVPITEIAFRAGYDAHESFIRAVRARYGVAPSELRSRAASPACHPHSFDLAAQCGLHVRSGVVSLAALTFISSGGSSMDVIVESRPRLRLATARHLGPYAEIAEAFHRLGQLAATHGLYAHVEPTMLALYHDDPEITPPAELRSDAALVVRDAVPLPPGLTEMELPAGRYARTTHMGSYAGLGDTWARFFGGWLPASGERVGPGASFELYVNDPRTTPTDALRTDLFVPLAG